MTLTYPRDLKVRGGAAPYIWFDINTKPPSMFNVFKMEGVCPENRDEDVIYIEANNSYLVSAFGNIKNIINFVEIKLGKKEFPFLTINTKIKSTVDTEKQIDISNQVPVIIVPSLGWGDFNPPYGEFISDLQGKCPRFSIFRRYIDTFKSSKNIKFSMHRKEKTLLIEANEDTTRHFTIFKNIDITDYDSDQPCSKNKVSALVEQKQISHWLHSIFFMPPLVHMYCKIEHNKHLRLFFRLGDEVMSTFIVPAEFNDDDDENSETESFSSEEE